MTCNCIEKVNKLLVPRNTRLKLLMNLTDFIDRPMIATEAIETGRGKPKPVNMQPRFCPFCGVAYVREG